MAGELPYAWEELWNNDCGIYYVDHITQTHYFEAPWSEVTRKRVLAIHDSLTLQAKELENQLELEREKREILELAEKKLATLEIQKHQIEEEIKHVQSSKGQTSKVNKLQGELQAVKYKLDCEKNEVLKVRRDHEILVEEIDAFQNKIRDLKTVNERLESENHKLAVEAKATNEAIADMKTMIEMEAAQRQALESYIKQLKQDVMMLYDEKEVTVENVDKSVKEAEGKADFEEEEPAWLKAANKNHVKAKEVDAISRNSSTSTDEEA